MKIKYVTVSAIILSLSSTNAVSMPEINYSNETANTFPASMTYDLTNSEILLWTKNFIAEEIGEDNPNNIGNDSYLVSDLSIDSLGMFGILTNCQDVFNIADNNYIQTVLINYDQLTVNDLAEINIRYYNQ